MSVAYADRFLMKAVRTQIGRRHIRKVNCRGGHHKSDGAYLEPSSPEANEDEFPMFDIRLLLFQSHDPLQRVSRFELILF